MLKKWEKPLKMSCVIYMVMFLFLLVLNVLTLYISDDFRYLFSFYDYERIESLSQIILSMRAHRYSMNGRLVVHTLVQIFGMLPMWFFDTVNAVMFVLQIALVHKIAMGSLPRSNTLLLTAFCGVWLFCPVFGQVNLWQDGAVNYLWGTVLTLLFLVPFMEAYLGGDGVKTKFGKLCFLCLAFGMGAYSETASAAAIFMALLFLLLIKFARKAKLRPLLPAAVAIAAVGYITIYLAPAQWNQKSVELTASAFLGNVVKVFGEYWSIMGILFCIFAVTLLLNLSFKTDRNRMLLALVFFAGSLAAHFILIFAQYYVPRSSSASVVYLLTADSILLYPLLSGAGKRKWKGLWVALLLVFTVPALIPGVADIADTYQRMKENEACIYACREQGMMDIEVPIIVSKTEYSVANGGRYLKEDPTTWPNEAMAVYYEINSLTGTYE